MFITACSYSIFTQVMLQKTMKPCWYAKIYNIIYSNVYFIVCNTNKAKFTGYVITTTTVVTSVQETKFIFIFPS